LRNIHSRLISKKEKIRDGWRLFGSTEETLKHQYKTKWNVEEEKYKFLRKGFLNHFNNFTQEQKEICTKYFQDRIAGYACKPPDFLNRCYYISSIQKIEKWFGNVEQFWRDLENQ